MSSVLQDVIQDAAKNYIPHAAILELTRICNLSCRHCYAPPDKGRQELSYEELCGVVDDLRSMGTLFVTFSGGDPTVNRRYLDIMRYTSDQRMCVQFFSNGLLIDERAADELAEMNVFHVGISLYGARAETHDDITTRKGSFQKTVRAAKLLRDRGIYVCFKFIAMNRNAGDAFEAAKMAEDLGIPIRVDTNITARDDLNKDTLGLRSSLDQHKRILREFQEGLLQEKNLDRKNGSDLWCVMGKTLISINAYGDVYPCVTLPVSAGNLRDRPLPEIWNQGAFFQEVRELPSLEKMHGCPECELRPWCNRCPGNTYTETGDLYGPSPAACKEAMLVKQAVNEKQGIHEEIPLPPGLQGHGRSGWTPGELVEFSGAGCGASCGSRSSLRSMADGSTFLGLPG